MTDAKSRAWRLSAPTDGQLRALARFNLSPPENATRGEVSDMLDWCNSDEAWQRAGEQMLDGDDDYEMIDVTEDPYNDHDSEGV